LDGIILQIYWVVNIFLNLLHRSSAGWLHNKKNIDSINKLIIVADVTKFKNTLLGRY
jgi:hypothetical protein